MSSIALFLLSLAFLSHVAGDFLLQTEATAQGKQSSNRILVWHISQHLLALLILGGAAAVVLARVAPGAFPPPSEALGVAAAIGLVHGTVDKIKILVDRRRGSSAATYVVDQVLHVVTIGLALLWLLRRHPEWLEMRPAPLSSALGGLELGMLAAALFIVAGLLYALRAGAIFSWMMTLPLTRERSEERLAADGVPAYPLRDRRFLWMGYAERGLGVLCILLGLPWALLLLFGARLGMSMRRSGDGTGPVSLPDVRALEILASLTATLVVGVTLRFLLV